MKEFNWKVRVYYEDTDASGLIYHGNYLKYMERARTEWLRDLGYSQDKLKEDHATIFAVTDVNMRFRRPARIDELLNVNASIAGSGGATIEFHQSITNETQDHLCDAKIMIACLDANTLKPKRLPDMLKEEFDRGN